MISFKVAYRKTKRGSVIKVREYAVAETKDALTNQRQQINPATEDAKFQYAKHLTPDEVKLGQDSGKLLVGTFQANRDNNLEGLVSVNLDGEDVHVLVQGRESLNRAIHEDQVILELLPKSEWKTKSDFVLEPDFAEELDTLDKDITNAAIRLQSSKTNTHIRPTGKIVAVTKRVWRQYTGVLMRHQKSLGRSVNVTRCLFRPSDRKIPIIRIETRQYETLKNQRLLVAIDSWPRASKYPQGHYIKCLGTIGDKDTENQVLLLEHDVPHLCFTDAVLNCLPSEGPGWRISEQELKLREDLRSIDVCSVDPPGCTDIDDALHYRDLDKETCEVGVHIADVSHFVKPGTALDQEAANRGTTVYLCDRRIDMIPDLLSSNLCSLIQHQDRLAFSAIWKIRKSDAEILDVRFVKSIISSRASLTYEKAQQMIDDSKEKSAIHKSLRGLNDLAKILKKKRLERGALVLARADEIRFVEVESETHDRDAGMEIQHKKMVDTNSMVEEFMLLANISVATKLLQSFPDLALLRRHPRPSKQNFEDLVESARVKGFDVKPDDGKTLSDSLDMAKIPGDYFFNLMLRMIATRCMTPAAYFCSGYFDPQVVSFTHFGLAADLYTHFTSPIRRYADLLVHRLLAASIGSSQLDRSLKNKNNIQMYCDQINYRHRMAQLASRASARLHTVLYIKSKKELVEDAHIFFIRQNAMQILIPRIAFEFTYFLQPSDDWQYNVDDKSQKNLSKNVIFKQFDKLKVHVSISTKADLRFSDKIQVRILEPPIDDPKLDETLMNETSDKIEPHTDLTDSMVCDQPDDIFVDPKVNILGKDSYDNIKKKIRLDLVEVEDDKPVIVVPGDSLDKYISKDATFLGPGLMRINNNVIATKGGILKMRSNNLFWIDSHQKRYVASRGECVIGIVRSKGSLHARIDINTADLATLSLLAFEGANKRNKPNLNVGDLVYAKVLTASRHVETELVCVNSNGKRDGLGLIGDKGGTLITVSIDTVRVLLSPQCDLLQKFGQSLRYETALGMNGRIWINSNEPSTTVRIANELRRFDSGA